MKKIILSIIVGIFAGGILFAGGLHLGMTGAVKQKVKELDEKVREKKAAAVVTSTVTYQSQGLSGTAAKGAAIASKTILVKDATGYLSASGTTDANGKFNIDITSMTFPLLLKVADGAATYFSIANASGTCNIHPFTDLVVRTYFKSAKGVSDMNTTFENNFASLGTLPTVETINTIKSVAATIVSSILERQGIDPLTYDMFTTPFDANSSGFDRAIEETQITAANDYSYVVIKDSTTNMVISTVTPTANDTTAPGVPANLSASGVSGTSIKLSWTASPGTDIAGYAIYRGGVKIEVVSYTTYIDAGLATGTEYSYTVEAYDWAGNKSAKTSAITETTPTEFAIAASASRIEFMGSVSHNGTNMLIPAAYQEPSVPMGYGGNNIVAQMVSFSGTLVGAQIPIATPATGSTPASASDGNNFMVVWNDYGTPELPSGDVYGQRISALGSLIGSPILINSGAGHSQGVGPQLSSDGTNYLVVWEDCRGGQGTSDIYGQFVSSSGALVGSEIAISTAADIQKNMSITYGNGKYLVMWTDNRRGTVIDTPDVYGRYVSVSGALSPEIAIDVNDLESEWGTSSAFDSINNRFFVTFHDEVFDTYAETDLYGRFVDSAGNVSSKIIISDKPGAQMLGVPVFDGTKYLVMWMDGLGVANTKTQAAFYDIDGNRLGNEFTLLTKKGTENFIGAGAGFGGNKYYSVIWRATVIIQPGEAFNFTAGDISGMIFDQ